MAASIVHWQRRPSLVTKNVTLRRPMRHSLRA
jgi:hypothetical protein